ncbi:MAG: hypothetical protein LC804_27520 [Acidobacteria bacterium]|nr:hypothetical protein [Acidobacteriota bacterium]
MRVLALVLACALTGGWNGAAVQRQRTSKPKPAPAPATTTAPAQVKCNELLGTGVRTAASYCFVLAGREPAEGVIVTVPAHTGEATLRFDLHNRHTYSEEEMRAGRTYAKYTAVIGVLTMKGELLDRGAVQTEFRAAPDLYERISGGAGPGGVKAVAPLGREQVTIPLPQGVDQVSLLGEILEAITAAGRETAAPGRPVALVSNVTVEYRPLKGRR